MLNSLERAKGAALAFAILVAAAAGASAQTTGQVQMTGQVSNFVELRSGGAVTLTGASGGAGVGTDGVANSPLAVVVDLGELGPANANSFVKLSVPLKMRSNVAYQLDMTGSVTGAGSTAYSLKASDVGFGLVTSARASSLHTGTDTSAANSDPTSGGATDSNGRWAFSGANSNLGAFSTAAEVLSGPRINKAVPRSDNTGLTLPAVFAIKPQFYDPTALVTITADFTISAP
jgi:hypothetical protein